MTDRDRLLDVLTSFARLLVTDYAVSDALHDLVDGSTAVLHVAGAGVSLVNDGRLTFATATPNQLETVEQIQEDTQSGPCVDAYRLGRIVVVSDLDQEAERWPALADAARQAGLVAVAGIPMHLNGTRIGVLNLYDDQPRDWTEDDIGGATLLADVASAYIANAQRLDQAHTTAEQLQRALDSRVIIEQAKGMIANQRGISVDAAFGMLRSHARSHQASLHAVAEAVVNLRLQL